MHENAGVEGPGGAYSRRWTINRPRCQSSCAIAPAPSGRPNSPSSEPPSLHTVEILGGVKREFSGAVAAWLRGSLKGFAEAHLLTGARGLPQFFRPPAVRPLWEAHQSGRENHAMRLWALFVLEVWLRLWMEGSGGMDGRAI